MIWIERCCVLALTIIVGALAITGLAPLVGMKMENSVLLVHMMASGVFVVGLPFTMLILLRHFFAKNAFISWLAYLVLTTAGLITIATVFVCMFPVASTEMMHQLMTVAWNRRIRWCDQPIGLGLHAIQSASS